MVFAMCSTRNQYFAVECLLKQLLLTQKNIERIYVFCEDPLTFTDPRVIIKNVGHCHLFANNQINGRQYSYMSLARCYFASLLPDEDRVIYLDTDIVVYDDLQELWDLNIDDYLLAAAEETAVWDHYTRPFMRQLPFYFSSGVLLMNLKRFREENIEQELDNLLNNCAWFFPDQDVLNIVCKNKVLLYDPKFNSCIVTTIVDKPIIQHGVPFKPWDPRGGQLFKDWARYYIQEV